MGAHRAENPRLRSGVIILWALVATILLVGIGIFGSLIVSGRITLVPASTPTPTATAEPEATIDTSFAVNVLNATGESGLATTMKDQIVAAGWNADTVLPSQASTSDFAETTVYYAFPADEAAARGLADVIGGAAVALSEVYQPIDDPGTADLDESQNKLLTVVIGLDRTAAGATPSATPAS
ncbi:LytR C-terminal domain-containing protein [Microbacterium sp. cx-55]|uniref:LytR C-terminal domain-containing protein n=1 Tax=Microbacterium sp. cx-55 TaxID=2875948 RepID=UPI001CBEC654|nr:LytR C-terminal domain-containing protein [Microbacterium sp. cx-55]UGB34435.1 LytR C-terminal domain-containing protein [Microbacterium sp. cx-55]